MKKFLFVFLLIMGSSCSAIQIGVSPDKIILSGETRQMICGDYTLLGDPNLLFLGELKFSEKNTKRLSDYTLSPENLEIEVIFEKETFIGKKKICIYSEKPLHLYGALTYDVLGANYAIGTWLEVKISNPSILDKTNLISGKIIQEIRENDYDLWFVVISLTIIFIAILINLFRQSRA